MSAVYWAVLYPACSAVYWVARSGDHLAECLADYSVESTAALWAAYSVDLKADARTGYLVDK